MGKPLKQEDAAAAAFKKWQSESALWREHLRISATYSPWTSRRDFVGKYVPRTDRVMDLLNLVCAHCCEPVLRKTAKQINSAMSGVFLDISQSHGRRCFTNAAGFSHTLTTSSLLYSYQRDALLFPEEHMFLHSHSQSLCFPPRMTPRQIRTLAGEGMAAPCLGQVIWAVFLAKNFA